MVNRSKKHHALLAAALLISSCGKSEGDIPDGSKLLLDAASPGGAGTAFPTFACTPTNWTDLSGSAMNGTVVGCTGADGWKGAGTTGDPYVLRLDGAQTRVTTSLNAQPTAMKESTWIVWVKPAVITPGTRQQILSIDGGTGAFNRAIVIPAGTSNFGVFTGAGTWQPTSYSACQWYQLAVVFTESNITFYKNGTPTSQGSAPTYSSTSAALSIGAASGAASEYFHGEIGWIAIYDRALTGGQISLACGSLQSRFAGVTCQ